MCVLPWIAQSMARGVTSGRVLSVYKTFLVVLQHGTTVNLRGGRAAYAWCWPGVWSSEDLGFGGFYASRLVSGRRLGPAIVPVGPTGPVTCPQDLATPASLPVLAGSKDLIGVLPYPPASRGTLRCLSTPHWMLQAGLGRVNPVACSCGASPGLRDTACGPSSTVPDLRGTGPNSKGPCSCSMTKHAASWTLLHTSSTRLVMARTGLRHSWPQQASASTCSSSSSRWSRYGRPPQCCGQTTYSSSSWADNLIHGSDTIFLPPPPHPHPHPLATPPHLPTPHPHAWSFFPATSTIAPRTSRTYLPSVQARPGLWTSDSCSSCILFLSICPSACAIQVWHCVPSGHYIYVDCTSRHPGNDERLARRLLQDDAGQDTDSDGWCSTPADHGFLYSAEEYGPQRAAAVESLWWPRGIMGST